MADSTNPADSPLSLKRLTNAFAAMLGRKPSARPGDDAEPILREVPTNTRTITEALLFVGQANNEPLSAEAIAATMRDVTPAEIVAMVAELNAEYEDIASAIRVAESAAGYKMVLRDELAPVRDKFHGKVAQATLTPAAMEVLSVIAYRQPVTPATLDELRRQKSQSLASSLVRRGLVRLERSAESPRETHYVTTPRFLQVFRLASIDQLPQAEEFEAA